MMQPAIVLIDHGHFQYNAVALGLSLWSLHDLVLEALYCGINLVLSRTLLQANDAVLRTSRLFLFARSLL